MSSKWTHFSTGVGHQTRHPGRSGVETMLQVETSSKETSMNTWGSFCSTRVGHEAPVVAPGQSRLRNNACLETQDTVAEELQGDTLQRLAKAWNSRQFRK